MLPSKPTKPRLLRGPPRTHSVRIVHSRLDEGEYQMWMTRIGNNFYADILHTHKVAGAIVLHIGDWAFHSKIVYRHEELMASWTIGRHLRNRFMHIMHGNSCASAAATLLMYKKKVHADTCALLHKI